VEENAVIEGNKGRLPTMLRSLCLKLIAGRGAFAWVVALALIVGNVRAASLDANAEFTAGNVAYEQGKFAAAASHYESLLTNGVSTASLWFNLGNARYKLGELGRALAAWRKAEQLTPRNADLRANLSFVRQKVYGEDAHTDAVRTVLRFLTPNEWALLMAAVSAAFFITLAWIEFQRAARPRGTLALLLVMMALTASAAVASYRHVRVSRQGVVVSRQCTVRFGPLEDSQSAFQLPDGSEVDIVDVNGSWYQVRTLKGRSGWVNRSDLVIVTP
jgi:tetratricopeptide (TPR) repeat protein